MIHITVDKLIDRLNAVKAASPLKGYTPVRLYIEKTGGYTYDITDVSYDGKWINNNDNRCSNEMLGDIIRNRR